MTIRSGIIRAAGRLRLPWSLQRYRPQDESATHTDGYRRDVHILPAFVSHTSLFSHLFLFFFFSPAASVHLLCFVPSSNPPLHPFFCCFFFFSSQSVTHSTSLIHLLFSCLNIHLPTHMYSHASAHTPVSNLYEMIPNAFGSPWEFPL